MKKKLLSILLVLCMALTLLPATALAEEPEAPAETIQQEESETPPTEAEQGPIQQEPIEQVPSNQEPPAAPPQDEPPVEVPVQEPQEAPLPEAANDLIAPMSETGENRAATALPGAVEGVITLTEDIVATAPLAISATVTIKGAGHTIMAANDFTGGALLSITSGEPTVTLENVIIDGNQKCRSVLINSGKLVVGDGTQITGGATADSYIGGVYVTNAAEFEMTGGSIEGNFVSEQYQNDGYCQYSADLWIGANAKGAISGGTVGNAFINANEYSATNQGSFAVTGGSIENALVETDKGHTAQLTVSASSGSIQNLIVRGGAALANALDNNKVANGVVDTIVLGEDLTGDFTVPAGKTVTLDLNGKTLTVPHGNNTTSMTVQGNLTVVDTTAAGPTVDSDYAVSYTGGKIYREVGTTLQIVGGGSFTLESGKVESKTRNGINVVGVESATGWDTPVNSAASILGGYVEAREYGVGVFGNGAKLTASGGVIVANDNAAVAGNGTCNTTKNDGGTTINITGGTIIGHIQTTGYIATGIYHPQSGVLNISGGTIYAGNGVGVCVRNGEVNISGDAKIIATGNEAGKVGDAATQIPGKALVIDYAQGYNHNNTPTDTRKVSVTGGYFSADQATVDVYTTEGNKVVEKFISGGYFTSDPGAYVADGKAAISSDKTGYVYMVRDKAVGEIEVKPLPAEPNVNSNIQDENAKNAAVNAAKTVEVPALVDVASKTMTEAEKTAAVDQAKQDLSLGADAEVILYQKAYLDIKLTAFTTSGDTVVLAMEITPKVQTIASTAKSADDIKLGDSDKNAVPVGGAEDLSIAGPTTITLTLPSGFQGKTVYIQHQAKDGRTYYYQATADGSGNLTFVSQHGFSPFTFSTVNSAAAEITANGATIGYATLQDAVNAVTGGQTIKALADGSATVSGNMTFTVETGGHNVTLTAASGYDLSQSASGNTITCTVSTHHTSGGGGSSGGGGGSSSSSTYAVTVDKSSGGTVTVSPKRASKGDTVTVTVKPDAGYELDELTVTDKDGGEVRVSGKDNKFTFTMPKSAVTVEASFQKVEEAKVSAVLPFTDVKPGDWCYDAVQYVYDNGLMAGTSAYTFTPGGATTRGMIVTILYRMEGKPSITGESGAFADVPAGQYYTDAVAWASANGIVSGYTNGNFGPNDPITREQMAAILYRYAGSPASSGMVLSEFTDADQISGYATDAMRWAVGSGLIAGTGNQALSPKGGASRAQVATILMRFCEMAAK